MRYVCLGTRGRSTGSAVSLGALAILAVVLATPRWADAASARLQIETGTYVGNGTTQSITGLGFRPDVVIVKADDGTGHNGVIRTSTMTGSKDAWTLTAPEIDLITSLDADGFTVGSDPRVNDDTNCAGACTYYWTAFRAGTDLKVGTYTGDGASSTDQQAITGLGFSTDYVLIIADTDRFARNRTPFGGAVSMRVRNAGQGTDTIPSLDPDGFTVQVGINVNESMNTSGDVYHYVAVNEVPGVIDVGEYDGDAVDNRSITGVGFPPKFVMLQTYVGGDPLYMKSDQMAGDASMDFLGALLTNHIQALEPDGFQVGNDTRVNEVGDRYGYVAFGVPASFDVFYSVGAAGSTNLMNSSPTVQIAGGVATFSEPQIGNANGDIGVGDEIDYGGGVKAYIKSIISSTQFVVHAPDGSVPSNVAGAPVNSIHRAFSDLVTAIANSSDPSHLGNTDLTASGADANLTWVCYKEGPLNVPNPVNIVINGYTTDSGHRITLTAAGGTQVVNGNSQRHRGTAGTGAVLLATGSDGPILSIATDYVTVEWLELDGNRDAGVFRRYGVRVDPSPTHIVLRDLIIHDFEHSVGANGIGIQQADPVSVYNNIVYDIASFGGTAFGIVDENNGNSASVHVYNNTVFNLQQIDTGSTASAYGIAVPDLTDRQVKNNIVIGATTTGAGTVQDYCVYTGTLGTGEVCHVNGTPPTNAIFQYNMSSDDTAVDNPPGTTSIPFENGGEFKSTVNGAEDLHLESDADAVGAGSDLGGTLDHDIDGQLRPLGSWEMGADEVSSSWWGSGWGVRRPITIDNTGREELREFPMLVCLDSTTVDYSKVQDNGEDLRFLDKDNATVLPHEIEEWNEGGTSYVWVNVPQIDADSASDFIYMYYDNPTAADGQDVNNTWDMSFRGVWHLKEDPTAPAPQFTDSTLNGNAGTANSLSAANQVPGQINGSLLFDDTNERHVLVPDAASLQLPAAMTVSAWIQTVDVDLDVGAIVTKWDIDPLTKNYWLGKLNSTDIAFSVDETQSVTASLGLVSDGLFHHVVGVADPATGRLRLYVDGFLQNETLYTGSSATGTSELHIGNGTSPLQEFDGIIDEVRVSGVARSADWIDAQYVSTSCGLTTVGGEVQATAVELLDFRAHPGDAAVELTWETGSEVDNVGFYLYRAETVEGPFELVNDAVIPGLGSSPVGASYRYVDTGLANGTTYFYELEDLESTGVRERHGPVSATPQVGISFETAGTHDGREDTSYDTRLTYGAPRSTSLRVLRRGRRGLDLELLTGGFYATPQEDGSVRLEIPGFLTKDETGKPAIPIKQAWVPVLAGRNVRIVSVQASDVETFSLRPSSAEVREPVMTPQGAVRLARRSQQPGRAFRSRGLYPEEAAHLVRVAFQEESKKALVELAPLRWDGSKLLVARRLVVRLELQGRAPDELSLGGSRGRRHPTHRNRGEVVAHVITRQSGLYGVAFEDVFGNHRGVKTSELRLSYQGEPVPYHVEPLASRFGRGSVLYFMSRGESLNPFGREAVYELAVAGGGETMPVLPAEPSGSGVAHYQKSLELEENHLFQGRLTTAPDVWLWDQLLAPVMKTYPFEITDLAAVPETARLKLWLQGTTDLEAEPDHHLRVYVNGALIQDFTLEGELAWAGESELLPGVLREGENLLEIENVGDTAAAYSRVMLSRFEVSYPRRTVVESGSLEGVFDSAGVAEVSGLSGHAVVVDTTEVPTRWLEQVENGHGVVRFRVQDNHRYHVADPSGVLAAEVREPLRPRLSSIRRGAQYVVIGPEAFLEAAWPLLELRASQGLSSLSASTEQIYSEYGHGETRPEALRKFLEHAYHHWEIPPRYVLLLGDGSFDFKNYLGWAAPNHVPPYPLKSTYIWTASDPAYTLVNGDDSLPDLAVGRLPAANLGEARVMVEKILAYESDRRGLGGNAVLIADRSDAAGDFEAHAEELASTLLNAHDVRKIYLSRLGTAATHEAIVRAFDRGSSLMSFIGHGGMQLWNRNILSVGDVGSLSLQARQPLLLTMNCLNGYFQFPLFDSLAEALLKAEGKGVIAAFSPSGLSLDGPAHVYHRLLMTELLHGDHDTLGDAILAAQGRYVDGGGYLELLSIYHLFGDPALRLAD